MQASLLPAQGEHLHAESPVHVLCLQPLPNGQGLLGQPLALGKAAVQKGSHGLRYPAEM